MSLSESNDLQELQQALKLSLQAQADYETPDADTAVQPMSEVDKQWLSGALSDIASSATDIAKDMKKDLETIDSLLATELNTDTLGEIRQLIENVILHVDDLDLAIDCIKIGGHKILVKCLNYHQLIRASCEVLAILSQNNINAQKCLLELDMVPNYFSLLSDTHLEEEEKKKVLYALSCLCRGYPPAIQEFRTHQGFYKLIPFIGNLHSLLSTKAVFLSKSLIEFDTSLKEEFLASGLLDILIAQLEEPRTETHEHILTLLASCLAGEGEGTDKIRAFCLRADIGIAKRVQRYAAQQEIHEEEREACQSILVLL